MLVRHARGRYAFRKLNDRGVKMAGSIELRIAAVDNLLMRVLPLLNELSQSAFSVHQGRTETARAVEDELGRWLATNQGLLPDSVTAPVRSLNSRITEWTMSMGSSATPHQFATDERASFAEVIRVLEEYRASLVEGLDDREEDLRIKVAKSSARHNPWVSGSFYLVVLLALLTLLAVISTQVPWWVVPLVILGGLFGVSIIGAFQLRQDGALSEKGFLALMAATLEQLPLFGTGTQNRVESRPETRNE
jgi:hypothetical protein